MLQKTTKNLQNFVHFRILMDFIQQENLITHPPFKPNTQVFSFISLILASFK